jgi:hypothetical protein
MKTASWKMASEIIGFNFMNFISARPGSYDIALKMVLLLIRGSGLYSMDQSGKI